MSNVYVAVCGAVFSGYYLGRKHEKICQDCRAITGDDNPSGEDYEEMERCDEGS